MPEEIAELRIQGTEPGDHHVPVDVLVRMLNGLQQLTLIFAAAAEHQEIQQRFKPSSELRSRYTLRCGVPTSGSYVMPVSLIDASAQAQLNPLPPILGNIRLFIDAAANDNVVQMRELLPESRYRERAFRELRTVAPRKGDRWTVTFSQPNEPTATIDARVTRVVERLLAAGAEEQTVMTVTGELVKIVFDEHKLTIRYPVNNREIECSYLPEIEDDLLESRRGPIQVTGTFVLDAEGHPSRLTNVTRIEPVDLSPLVFGTIEVGERQLKAGPELRFTPHLDEESEQFYVVEDATLDLCVHAPTREELGDEIAVHLLLAWDEYALADPQTLTPKAQELRQALRARLREGE
jgi:hypothetical protein